KDRHCLALRFHTRNFDNPSTEGLCLLNQVRSTELILSKRIDIGDRFASCRLADKLNFIPFNIIDGQNAEFGKEVEGQLVYGIAQDRLLDEQYIAFGFLDLFADVEEISTLLF